MKMKELMRETRLCTCCMERHEVKIVLVNEESMFKNTKVTFDAIYYYCDRAEEFYMDEALMQRNDIQLKESWRIHAGLSTEYNQRI